jgi:hypothetical protein
MAVAIWGMVLLSSVGSVVTVDIVLVWKRAGGNGKNLYKKLQSSH